MIRYALSAAFAALFALPAAAHDFTTGDLTVEHPYARATTSQAQMAGGFMTITNNGTESDRLIGVEGAFARDFQVHLTEDNDGVMRMREVEAGVEIPAGESVELMRGSYHVMFMGLDNALAEGETYDATLIFENAGELPITFKVEAFNYQPEHSDGSMAHGEMSHDSMGHDEDSDNHAGHGHGHSGHD
ncbi:copper chaperone PCu(A)C [Pontivivens insulae]|uniref:Copper chaperone PCu(A)C n=1 Tax=Pontivivens insulae TaxID=1639689 RepID=A0A2R8AEL3_9RHOB|nr:copper chaperone PCu(A)C [Pontivivens insulae]RED11891.1 hypothetical protein DFR53_2603 [Pontivivens insulae]SPF30647.1 hypothetical protein POI8812_02988 [Pontivivens insulae]